METNLCVAGFGGQGVMTLGKFLASATCDSTDKNVTFFPSYGAEQRGGTANCFVVISDEMVGAPLGDVMDDLIVMNGPSLQKFLPTLKQGGTLFINSSIVPEEDIDAFIRGLYRQLPLPLPRSARRVLMVELPCRGKGAQCRLAHRLLCRVRPAAQ